MHRKSNPIIDVEQLFRDYGISYQTEGHKHCRPGWVNTACPFCSGNPGLHLGYCIDKNDELRGRFVCWRCGGKSTTWALKALLSVSYREAEETEKRYSKLSVFSPRTVSAKARRRPKTVDPPQSLLPLTKKHRKYLKERKFNPEKLIRLWDIGSIGHEGGIYKFRMFIPVYFNGKLVSFQCRSLSSDNKNLKYLACEKELEVIEHKHLLYGYDQVPGNTIVIVEGVTDVWRLGPGAVATFGIKYKVEQIELMKQFSTRYILYDSDPQAIKQAKKLESYLSQFSGTTERLEPFSGDPGDFDQKEANKLMKQLLR